jgi:carboxypeptidase Q
MRKPSGSAALTRPMARLLGAVLACALASAPACSPGNGSAASRYRDAADRIRDMGLRDEGAIEFLRRITAAGPRLTGSAEAAAAVEIGRRLMLEMGLDRVHLELVTVNRWTRGPKEEARIVGSASLGTVPLAVCALGGSIATPDGGLTAPVVEVGSFEELDRLGPAVSGRIVFFNRPMDRTRLDAFAAYGGAADQRVRGASEAARHGAVAALVRSLTFRVDDHPHTGLMTYAEGVARIPAAAVSTAGADLLSSLLKKEGAVSVHLKMGPRDEGPVPSANVVGEITGTDLPGEIILLGGHLDSWDLGTGAHDDGAGCAVSLEALRLIKALGLRPRRTVRAVLFMDEEFGGTGGRFYARAAERTGERHLAAMESDRGGFLPLGLAGGSDARAARRLGRWLDLVRPLGIDSLGPGGGGVDVGPIVRQGAVPLSVIPDAQAYFDVHHSALDVLSAVGPRELEFQAVILATYAYVLAQEGI